MFLGYNTNGFAHHPLEDAIQILKTLGYGGVAITLDHYALNPFTADPEELAAVEKMLRTWDLRSAIETGARFLLSPWDKHQPTLISPTEFLRQIRFRFLHDAI